MDLELKCPKCGGLMEQGFIPDYHGGGTMTMFWYKGRPKKNLLGQIKVRPRHGVPIGAYRSIGCGYLEFYAWNEFAAKRGNRR